MTMPRLDGALWRWALVVLAVLTVGAWAVSRRYHYVDCRGSWTSCLVLDRWTGRVRLVPVERPKGLRSEGAGAPEMPALAYRLPRLPRLGLPRIQRPQVARPQLPMIARPAAAGTGPAPAAPRATSQLVRVPSFWAQQARSFVVWEGAAPREPERPHRVQRFSRLDHLRERAAAEREP